MNLISIRNATRARKQAEKSGVSLNSKARRSKISSHSARHSGLRKFSKGFHPSSGSIDDLSTTGLIPRASLSLPRPVHFHFRLAFRFLANKFRTKCEISLVSSLSGGLFSHPKMQSNPTSETSSTSFRHEFNFRLHCFLPAVRITKFPISPRLSLELHFARRGDCRVAKPSMQMRNIWGALFDCYRSKFNKIEAQHSTCSTFFRFSTIACPQ